MVAFTVSLYFRRVVAKDGCTMTKRILYARFSRTGTTKGYLDGLSVLWLYDDKRWKWAGVST
jgi:hypothetical protein